MCTHMNVFVSGRDNKTGIRTICTVQFFVFWVYFSSSAETTKQIYVQCARFTFLFFRNNPVTFLFVNALAKLDFKVIFIAFVICRKRNFWG